MGSKPHLTNTDTQELEPPEIPARFRTLMRLRTWDTILVMVALVAATAAHAEPPKAAVFDFQLANLGAQGPTAADVARLSPLSDLLRTQLRDTGRYEIILRVPADGDDGFRSNVMEVSGAR